MYLIWGILFYVIFISNVSAEGKDDRSKFVGGYAAGVSGMPEMNVANCENKLLLEDKSLSNPLECARTCYKGDPPKICYYKFVIERYPINGSACSICDTNVTNHICANCQCIPGNGVQRMALIVNRMLPGPSIQVCLGDKIVVDVQNNIKEDAVTIHWHGLFQKGTQYYDGVPAVTQCPIAFRNTFRYQFYAGNSGTHFWHAHTGLQKMDGIQGSLVIREPRETDPNGDLYDYDLANHVIFITDWMNEESTERFPGRNDVGVIGQTPDAILINGKGRSTVNTPADTRSNTSLDVITVDANKRYRFRLINSFCGVCPGQLTIEKHNLTGVAADGQSFQAIKINSINSFAAERYDFVIETNQEPGAYWIQLRLLGICASNNIQQLAVLQYTNANTVPVTQAPTYQEALPTGIVLNPETGNCLVKRTDAICISDLRHTCPEEEDVSGENADVQIYLPIGFQTFTLDEIFTPNTYTDFLVPATNATVNAMLNNIVFRFPPSPPLSQLKDLPPDQFCDSNNLPARCNTTCTCTHMVKIPLHSLVEVALIDVSQVPLMHPIHLHGYAFNVMTMGQPLGSILNGTDIISVDYVKNLDKEGKLNRNFDSPPGKDTIPVPNNGFAIFRFRADNPGYWFIHCHFVYHQMVGMEVIFNVGTQSDLPPVPCKFPKCGDYMPKISHKFPDSSEEIW